MREFRVWCKDRNEWETHGTCLKSDGTILHLDKGRIMPLRPDTHIVEFYTGLKDRHGDKVFDGDIVANKFDHSIRATIVYSSVSFCYLWNKYTSTIRRCKIEPMFTNTDIVMEIIGNIHDNPELLESEQI